MCQTCPSFICRGGVLCGFGVFVCGFELHPAVEFAFAFLDFFNQLVSGGEVEFVFAGDDGGVDFREGHPDGGVVLLRAEKDADGGILVGQFLDPVVVVDVHLSWPRS